MSDIINESPLTYALNASGRLVSINDVENGFACNCRCPKCKEALNARKGHGGHQPHFAHIGDSNCHGSYMTALHKLAEQIIEEEKAVMAPDYKGMPKQRLSFVQVEVEQRVERKDLQPDVVGVTEDGLSWIIEIRNTHEVDEVKKAKLIESNFTCLEIDVRVQTLENLKSFILESVENREWINNPNYDAQIIEAKSKRVSKVEKYLLSCTELTIPAYEDFDSRKISIKEAFVLSKTDDKLFSQVKVLSSDGTPFVFNIGSRDILETNIHSKRESDCNELIIVTDSISLDDDIYSNALDLSWSFCIYKKAIVTLKGISHGIKGEDEYQPHHRNRDDSFVSDYYGFLMSSNAYETEKGYFAEIAKCDIVYNIILLLYKDPVEVRTFTPYHIAVISTDNGNLIRNDVAVFTNIRSAMKSYYERLSSLRNSMCSQPAIEIDDKDLPF